MMDDLYFRILYPLIPGSYLLGMRELAQHLIRNKDDIEFLMFRTWKADREHYDLVIPYDEIYRAGSAFQRKSPVKGLIHSISENNFPMCETCGCHFFNRTTRTFRDNHGCVGGVVECPVCAHLNDTIVATAKECWRQGGTPAAIHYLKTILKNEGE
jgi:hypothetical protein